MRTEGIAVLCDSLGRIQEIVRDDLGVAGRVERGQPLATLMHSSCEEKTQAFLQALRAQNAAFNWELNVPAADGGVEPLHFAGGAAEGGFLVAGARSRSGVSRFYEDLVRINNEQANVLRAALKDASLQMRERDSHHFDELSQLNNDLSTAQRELAKSNAELSRLNDQKSQFLGMAAALVEANVARNRVLAAKKGIEIRRHSQGEALEMVIDPTKIEQVLNNLIGNAVKFSPPGSAVDVRVTPGGERVTLAVEDRGPGIPAEERDKLFRPFARTRVRSTAGEKGADLGLAIVKRIVEGHGGEIRVESPIKGGMDRGSVFYVSLPVRGLEGRWPES